MKKRIALFVVVLISLLSIVAEAAFSGKYLCVRRSGKTYKHRLYTAKSDFGTVGTIPVVATRTGGATYYGRLIVKASPDYGYACIKHASGTCELWERAHNYLGSWSLSYSPRDITTDGTYFYVTAASAIWKINSSGSVVTSWSVGTTPAGIVYHPTLGVLFVVDNTTDRVNIVSLSGSIISYFGSSGSGNGQFQSPWGIALDGNYIVVQDVDGRTQWFSVTGSSGSFYKVVSTGGTACVAIDPANGTVYVSNTSTQKIRQYSTSGSYITEWLSGPAYGLAVDINGNIFSTETAGDTIRAFRPGGSLLYPVYNSSSRETDPHGLTFDQAGNLYVVGYTSKRIARFD